MAREWSRRSIEELVRGYMRRHTPPSSDSSDSSCDGADYIVREAVIPNLYDAEGKEILLPLYRIDLVEVAIPGVKVPDKKRVIRFGDVPPIHFKTFYDTHFWVIGLIALYGMSAAGWPLILDLYDEAGGLVTTVGTMPSSMMLNGLSGIEIPYKLEIKKHSPGDWKNFPGCYFGTESVTYVTVYKATDNATNPFPEGWCKRVAFYKARSPYE